MALLSKIVIARSELEPSAIPNEKTVISEPIGAKSGALDSETRPTDPDLATIIDAWAGLPEPIREGILAMVRSIGTPGAKRPS